MGLELGCIAAPDSSGGLIDLLVLYSEREKGLRIFKRFPGSVRRWGVTACKARTTGVPVVTPRPKDLEVEEGKLWLEYYGVHPG